MARSSLHYPLPGNPSLPTSHPQREQSDDRKKDEEDDHQDRNFFIGYVCVEERRDVQRKRCSNEMLMSRRRLMMVGRKFEGESGVMACPCRWISMQNVALLVLFSIYFGMWMRRQHAWLTASQERMVARRTACVRSKGLSSGISGTSGAACWAWKMFCNFVPVGWYNAKKPEGFHRRDKTWHRKVH